MKYKSKEKIGVIGAGSWGTVLSQILSDNADKVYLYSKDANISQNINENHINQKYFPNTVLSKNITAVNNFDFLQSEDITLLVIVVPVKALDEVLRSISETKNVIHGIVICSKGLEQETLLFPTEIARKYFDKVDIAYLAGPNFASELILKKVAKSIIASKNIKFADRIKMLFKNNYFYPESSSDVTGTEVCSALKNVFAIAFGIAEGLELGENFKAALLVKTIQEVNNILKHFKSSNETILSLTGIGDLVLTCYNFSSRNMKFGYQLATSQDVSKNETVEGYYTTKSMIRLLEASNLKIPICQYVNDVLERKESVSAIIKVIEE